MIAVAIDCTGISINCEKVAKRMNVSWHYSFIYCIEIQLRQRPTFFLTISHQLICQWEEKCFSSLWITFLELSGTGNCMYPLLDQHFIVWSQIFSRYLLYNLIIILPKAWVLLLKLLFSKLSLNSQKKTDTISIICKNTLKSKTTWEYADFNIHILVSDLKNIYIFF